MYIYECTCTNVYMHKYTYMDVYILIHAHMCECTCVLIYICGRRIYGHTATRCNTLQCTITHCNALQHTATHCNTLQHTATHCNTLQHTTTRTPYSSWNRPNDSRHNRISQKSAHYQIYQVKGYRTDFCQKIQFNLIIGS